MPTITWWVDNEQIIEERNDGYSFKADSLNHYLNDVRDTPSRLLVSDKKNLTLSLFSFFFFKFSQKLVGRLCTIWKESSSKSS